MIIKKNLSIFLLAISLSSLSFVFCANIDSKSQDSCDLIKMPTSKILYDRLMDGFAYFADITKIHEHLGDKEKSPFCIALAIACALDVYTDKMKNNQIEMNKDEIINRLMQGFSDPIIKKIKQYMS